MTSVNMEVTSTTLVGQTPRVKWAQDSSKIFLRICLEDCKDPQIDIRSHILIFEGTGGLNKLLHKVAIHFLKEIDPDKSKFLVRDREIEFTLMKLEDGLFWNRLLDSGAKHHWLSVDFDKFKGETESEQDDNDEEIGEHHTIEEKYGRPPLDYQKHISENISKGSSLCPLGSAVMGKAMKMEQGLNKMSEERGEEMFDLHGYDGSARDSDDEPLSDIDEISIPIPGEK